jgi:hypothetical protein
LKVFPFQAQGQIEACSLGCLLQRDLEAGAVIQAVVPMQIAHLVQQDQGQLALPQFVDEGLDGVCLT